MSGGTFSEAQKTQYADSALLRARVLLLQRHLIQKYIYRIGSRNLTSEDGVKEGEPCMLKS